MSIGTGLFVLIIVSMVWAAIDMPNLKAPRSLMQYGKKRNK